jgi:hypothetical protein
MMKSVARQQARVEMRATDPAFKERTAGKQSPVFVQHININFDWINGD